MKVIICINQNTKGHKMKVKVSHSALPPCPEYHWPFSSLSDSLPYQTDLNITLGRRRSQLTLGGLAGATCPQAQHFHSSALAKVSGEKMEVKKARDKKKGQVRVNITPSFPLFLPHLGTYSRYSFSGDQTVALSVQISWGSSVTAIGPAALLSLRSPEYCPQSAALPCASFRTGADVLGLRLSWTTLRVVLRLKWEAGKRLCKLEIFPCK